ncbi:MAG: hypothetical protein HYX78_02245 [Armatimonadetes bacterium]|nr:hypothetical protein [Armatimonadota bacterium]
MERTDLADKDKVRDILICGIANALGINADLLESGVLTRALQSAHHFDPVYFHDCVSVAARTQDKRNVEKRYQVATSESDMLGYYYAHEDWRNALKYALSVDDLQSSAQSAIISASTMDWDIYTSMSVHCRMICNKYLLNSFLHDVSRDDRKEINKLIRLTGILAHPPLRNVLAINQTASALRFNLLLQSLASGKDGLETENSILSLYGEAASIAGYIGSYRDIAIKSYFLHRYHGMSEKRDEAIKHATKSLALAEAVGDVRGERRARKLLVYL